MKISSFSLLWIGNLVLGQFRHIIDDSPEGQPHIFPSEGGQHLFNYGRSLCENRDGMGYYSGVRGMLTDGCCGALYLFVALLADKWKSSLLPPSDLFRYVETGSYQGLSAHIIALSLKNSVGISNAVIYCHDLFDVYIPDKSYSIIEHSGLWDNFMDGAEGRLEKFYSNVRRNNLEKTILPISGPSGKTLKIHPNESVHMVYIDGDHTYQGSFFKISMICLCRCNDRFE